MLTWVIAFLVLAIVAGFFGFSGVAATSAGIARTLFSILIILFFISLLMHLFA